MKQEEQKVTNINMRYPSDVLDAIRQFAKDDGRSFHNMVIWILRAYIKHRLEKEDKESHADLRVQA